MAFVNRCSFWLEWMRKMCPQFSCQFLLTKILWFHFTIIFKFHFFFHYSSKTVEKKYTDETKSIWAKNVNGQRPLYKPICGYTGSECPQNLTVYIAIGSGLILLLFLAASCGIGYTIRWGGIFWNIIYFHWFSEKMREKERLTRECQIPYLELKNMNQMRSSEQLRELDQGKSVRSMNSNQTGIKLIIFSNFISLFYWFFSDFCLFLILFLISIF